MLVCDVVELPVADDVTVLLCVQEIDIDPVVDTVIEAVLETENVFDCDDVIAGVTVTDGVADIVPDMDCV